VLFHLTTVRKLLPVVATRSLLLIPVHCYTEVVPGGSGLSRDWTRDGFHPCHPCQSGSLPPQSLPHAVVANHFLALAPWPTAWLTASIRGPLQFQVGVVAAVQFPLVRAGVPNRVVHQHSSVLRCGQVHTVRHRQDRWRPAQRVGE